MCTWISMTNSHMIWFYWAQMQLPFITITPEYSLEGLMLKLKLQYFGHLLRRTDSLENKWRKEKRPWCWERLKAGGKGDDNGWDGWMISLTQWTWVCVNSGSWWWTGKPGVLQSMGSQRVGHDWVTELNLPKNTILKKKPFGWFGCVI